MSEKRFRVRFEQEDGRGEIVDEKGVELSAREVVDCLNEQQNIINQQQFQLDMSRRVIGKLKKDIKMILNMPKEEQQELRCYFHIWYDTDE